MRRILPTIILLSLLATSCSKDELVQPVVAPASGSVAKPKNATLVTPPSTDGTENGTPRSIGRTSSPEPNVSSTDGSVGISDDGEDLSDSEKSRKKRRR
jgi:hypothetical protein